MNVKAEKAEYLLFTLDVCNQLAICKKLQPLIYNFDDNSVPFSCSECLSLFPNRYMVLGRLALSYPRAFSGEVNEIIVWIAPTAIVSENEACPTGDELGLEL